METNKDGTKNVGYDSYIQVQADFSGVIMGIKAKDQVNLFSNSNYLTGSIEVSNKEIFSTETMGHSIFDLKKSREVSLESKDAKLISTNKQEFNFDRGWVEKSPLRK